MSEHRPHPYGTHRWSRSRIGALLGAALGLALTAAGCGGGGGGGGGGSKPPAAPAGKLVVSGTVRDISGGMARRVARSDLPAIPGSQVEVKADLDGDGAFGADEVFGATADERGYFAVAVPASGSVAKLRVRAFKAGHSEFVREYAEVADSLILSPVLSAGEVASIDLSGVASGPARGGRVALLGDEVVTVSLLRDRSTGRRSARAVLGRAENPAAPTGTALVSATFPVRGLRLAADAPAQVYADVAYLDTVNDPDAMPGGFRAEGEGDTPVDQLVTYAASQIRLYDGAGQELMTNPADRSQTIRIKIAVPVEAFASLEDENPATPTVEIPLFYYDDQAGIWKLHKDEFGAPAYGVLEDNFGNRLTRSDLALLQATRVEATTDGDVTVPDPRYAPPGATPAEVTIYGVGDVHHFTTWNCDRSGRSSSFNAEFRDKNGRPLKAEFRIRRKNGGTSADSGRPDPNGRVNVHIDYDRNSDSLIKKLLDRASTAQERARILEIIQSGQNPYAKQALIEALRRYGENLRDDIATDTEGGDLGRGFRAIFNNKTIQDAFISTDGLDCTKTPDLCNGILGAAAETVNQSKSSQKAVAVLMQIAVDAYNPGSVDFDYLVNKGVDLLDATVEMEGIKDAKGDMEQVYNGVKKVKELADKVKEARKTRFSNWQAYWDAAKEFKEALSEVKNVATTIGGRAGRVASRRANLSVIAPPEPDPQTDEERQAAADRIEQAILYEGMDLGGVFFGASPLGRYQWGYYEGPTFVSSAAPVAMPLAGGDLASLEIFDGADWVAVPGASDLGVAADFIPIPAVTSFGSGSAARPVVHLGTWTFDVDPNVTVTGKLLIRGTTQPARNAKVVVEGQEFSPDANGDVAGAMSAFVQQVAVSVPGAYWGSKPVAGGKVDLGTIEVPEAIFWDSSRYGYEVQRGGTLEIDPGARSVSGDPVLYTFRLYRSSWAKYSAEAPLEEVTAARTYSFPTDAVGWFWLDVEGTVNGAVSAVGYNVNVRNNPPVIQGVAMSPAAPKVGDEIRFEVTATDPDGDGEIGWKGLSAWCEDEAGARYWFWTVQEDDAWVARTDRQLDLYRAPGASLTCTVDAWVSDRLGGSDRASETFTLAQSQVAPEVSWEYLAPEYTLACWRYDPQGPCELYVRPGYSVSFLDRNDDLDHYELDCGTGAAPVAATAPITEACRFTEPGDYTVTYAAVDRGDRRAQESAVIHVLYPLRLDVTYPEGLAVTSGTADGFDLVELPAAGATDQNLTVTVVSDNGASGYDEGNGTIDSSSYTLTYRAGNTGWSEYLASGSLTGGAVNVPLTKPGTYSVSVYGSDSRGMSASFSRTFKVTAPFDGEITVGGRSVQEFKTSARPWTLVGEDVALDVTATGPAGWSPQYAWTSNGVLFSNQKSPTVSFSVPGEYRVRLELRNGADTVDRQVVREVTLPVYAPLTATFASGYAPAVEGEVRAGDAYGVSLAFPQGQNVTAAYWTVLVQGQDGSYRPSETHKVTDTESLTARSFLFTQTGTYQVRVTLVDDRGVTTTVNWDQPIVVARHAPTVDTLTASRSSGRPPLGVTFAATASDTDARAGEVLAYQWFVNGQSVAGATAATFQHTFAQEGTYTVRVRVTDATGLSAERSVQVVAEFRPPVIAEVQADPGSGPAPLAVTFTAVATDSDGTIASYAWDATNDGTFEQQGASPTFAFTYAQPGTYTVRVRVTDNDGRTAERTRPVYALDPAATAVVFEFKELRSDGFGPAHDFTQTGPHGSDGLEQMAHTPLGDVNVRPENLVDLAPVMEFTELGFYGPYGMSWGSPSTTLFQVAEAATYTVGMRGMTATADARTVQFPGTYACGYLAYQDWAESFGTYQPETLASRQILPMSQSMTTAGQVKVLALLGDQVVTEGYTNRCVPTYYGYATGTGSTLTLDGSTAISAYPLVTAGTAADQYVFDALTVDAGDGIEFTLWNTDLDRDPSGRPLIPVVPGATYALRFHRDVGARTWQFEARVSAAAVAAQSQANVDFSAVVERTDLEVANTVVGDSLILVWESPWGSISGNIYTSGGTGPVGAVPSLAGAGATVALSYSGGGANAGFHREEAAAGLVPALDLGNPGVGVSVATPGLTVDTTAQTITLDLGAVTGDVCVVTLNGTYNDPALTQYAYRNGAWTFVTDGSVTSYTFGYAIPESSFSYPGGSTEVFPATSALTEVQAEVSCGSSDLGYGGLLPEILRDLDVYGLSGSVLVQKGLVTEALTRRASWTAP